MEEEIFNKIDEILERKKQIILYGVPGVGKTYLVQKYVEYLSKLNKNTEKSCNYGNENNYENKHINKSCEIELKPQPHIIRDICYLLKKGVEPKNILIKKIIENANDDKYWSGKISEDLKRKLIEQNLEILKHWRLISGSDYLTLNLEKFEKRVLNINENEIYSSYISEDSINKIINAVKITISFKDLIDAGIIKEGEKIFGKYKGKDYIAEIMDDGSLYYDGEIYDTPSKIAEKITNTQQNGWRWWKYKDEHGNVKLIDELRNEYIKLKNIDKVLKINSNTLFSLELQKSNNSKKLKINNQLKMCKTVTFHQSFSYEEFIEGLKPKTKNGEIVYEVEDGIFKKICILAIWEVSKNKNNENENLNYLQIKQKVINAIKNKELTKDDFKNTPKFILIIDEINRGNISNIFGELITLLEKDKRLTEENEMIVELPYSKEPFAVPPNLYIIGTMNTADRSIALLDIALRRRFGFLEIEPNYDLITKDNLIKKWKEKCNDEEFNKIKNNIEKMFQELGDNEFLKKLLKTINDKITLLKDRDHRIGHSYFLNIKDIKDLKFVWYNEIIPLLMEYFYNDWESLKEILKDFVEEIKTNVKINSDLIDNEEQKIYRIKEFDNDNEFIEALNSIIR